MRSKLLVSCLFGLGLCTQAIAAEEKVDHLYCFVAKVTTIQHADGFASGIIDNVGMLNDPENHPFHGLSCHCIGTFTVNAGQYEENGTCECANPASDKIFGIWARKGDPTKAEGTWHVVHGTGKFAGWSIDTKWTPGASNFGQVGGAGTVNGCNHDCGMYSSK